VRSCVRMMGVGSFSHRPGLPDRPQSASVAVDARQLERSEAHGELLLDILKFALVGLLGFMPLAVIHWSDRHPRRHDGRPNRIMTSLGMLKTSVMIVLSDWSSHLPLL